METEHPLVRRDAARPLLHPLQLLALASQVGRRGRLGAASALRGLAARFGGTHFRGDFVDGYSHGQELSKLSFPRARVDAPTSARRPAAPSVALPPTRNVAFLSVASVVDFTCGCRRDVFSLADDGPDGALIRRAANAPSLAGRPASDERPALPPAPMGALAPMPIPAPTPRPPPAENAAGGFSVTAALTVSAAPVPKRTLSWPFARASERAAPGDSPALATSAALEIGRAHV